MDRRGSGASDAVPLKAIPTWEELAEDMTGVLDAAESKLTDLIGVNEVGPIAVLFAAMHPERVGSLILINTAARYMEAPDYPIWVGATALDAIFDLLASSWGSEEFAAATAPSRAHDREFHQGGGQDESGVSYAQHGRRSDAVLLEQHGRAPVPAVGADPDPGAPSHRQPFHAPRPRAVPRRPHFWRNLRSDARWRHGASLWSQRNCGDCRVPDG